jgi:hypothetical protein
MRTQLVPGYSKSYNPRAIAHVAGSTLEAMAQSSRSHPPFYRRSFLVVPYSKKTSLREALHYNDQSRRQLHTMAPDFPPEALRLLREFGNVAHEASEKFRWGDHLP